MPTGVTCWKASGSIRRVPLLEIQILNQITCTSPLASLSRSRLGPPKPPIFLTVISKSLDVMSSVINLGSKSYASNADQFGSSRSTSWRSGCLVCRTSRKSMKDLESVLLM